MSSNSTGESRWPIELSATSRQGAPATSARASRPASRKWPGRGGPRLAREFTRRGPHRPVEGPLADVIDLLLHGLRERHDVGGRVEQVLIPQLTLLETGARQRRHHALLDLGARPALREGLERREIEARKIDPTPPQMDAEDVEPLLFERQIDEEHFIEAPFADHLSGLQVDAVGGGAADHSAGLLLHPCN